jgi:hypothetical protein
MSFTPNLRDRPLPGFGESRLFLQHFEDGGAHKIFDCHVARRALCLSQLASAGSVVYREGAQTLGTRGHDVTGIAPWYPQRRFHELAEVGTRMTARYQLADHFEQFAGRVTAFLQDKIRQQPWWHLSGEVLAADGDDGNVRKTPADDGQQLEP